MRIAELMVIDQNQYKGCRKQLFVCMNFHRVEF